MYYIKMNVIPTIICTHSCNKCVDFDFDFDRHWYFGACTKLKAKYFITVLTENVTCKLYLKHNKSLLWLADTMKILNNRFVYSIVLKNEVDLPIF